MAEHEKAYYQSGEVLITNTRAEIGGRTFAMANITAVSMGMTPNATIGCGCIHFLLTIGGVAIFAGLLEIHRGGVGVLLVGLIIVGAVCAWWRAVKPRYSGYTQDSYRNYR